MTAPPSADEVAARLAKVNLYRCPHCRQPKSTPMGLCSGCSRFGEARTREQIAADDAHWKAGKYGPLPSATHLIGETK